ncbi:MAG: AAA family ATPase [Candidatus Helarchaeota archaeon]
MEKEEDYKIEKIGTPAGDAASAASVVKAVNYILLKLKEFDDYYTDKLKFLDISSLDPIIEDIHEKINDIRTNQDLIIKRISELENGFKKTEVLTQESEVVMSGTIKNEAKDDQKSEIINQHTKYDILNKSNINELFAKLINLELNENKILKFFTILAPEEINKSLEPLGAYVDQKDLLGITFSFLTLPDDELPHNYKLMIFGPDGNGKTSIIHALAKKYGYHLILPDFSILKAYPSNKQIIELITLFKNIKEHNEIKPCILFLDNFELLAGTGFSKHILKTLALEMDKINLADDRILIVAATQNLEEIEEPILKIFDDFIEFSNPNELEKSKILQSFIDNIKLQNGLEPDELINELAFNNGTPDFSCSDLRKLIKNVNLLALKEHRDYCTKTDFTKALQKIKDRRALIKAKRSGKHQKSLEKLEKIQVLEDEIANLKNITATSTGIIKHSLRLALSENFDFVHRLFNLFKAKNEPFDIEEASKNLGITIEETRKILGKDPFRIIFPKIKGSYHLSFGQKMFDEISMEVSFALQGD